MELKNFSNQKIRKYSGVATPEYFLIFFRGGLCASEATFSLMSDDGNSFSTHIDFTPEKIRKYSGVATLEYFLIFRYCSRCRGTRPVHGSKNKKSGNTQEL